MVTRVKAMWAAISLTQQFAMISLVVLLCGMLIIGSSVAQKIESEVTRNAAIDAAFFLNNFVAPTLQVLAYRSTLDQITISELDDIYQMSTLKERIISFKVWDLHGRILYATDSALIGRSFPISDSLAGASSGLVSAKIAELDQDEHVMERQLDLPLIEIYSPIRARGSERVIGVAEFYDNASNFVKLLSRARIETWLVVAGVTLAMFLLLFSLVKKANLLIESQRNEMQAQVTQLSELLAANKQLSNRVQAATRRAVATNERILRRLGSELHDGPAQLLSFALLRLGALVESDVECARENTQMKHVTDSNVSKMKTALADALKEIRAIAAGLAVPELSSKNLKDTLEHAVRQHNKRTGSAVNMDLKNVSINAPLPQKIGAYRVVQEALTNTFRHATGANVYVNVEIRGDSLQLEVVDEGPGFDLSSLASQDGDHLGLSGLRERVESLGGQVWIETAIGRGTQIKAHLPLEEKLLNCASKV